MHQKGQLYSMMYSKEKKKLNSENKDYREQLLMLECHPASEKWDLLHYQCSLFSPPNQDIQS